ncbi:MAG TPA: hypothetical protein DEQ30_12870 [Porphyromonadaceae bacterium]|nr:hypothetical protein [Porphyromonadaceae bacterium]
MLENDMVDTCYKYFLSNSDDFEFIVREVPFLSRCIDLVLVTKDYKTVTIEFKIKNWREALAQAKNHKLGADKSYICLPEKSPSIKLLELLDKEQIGLYLYNPSAPCIIAEYYPAPDNAKKISAFNDLLVRTTATIYENTCIDPFSKKNIGSASRSSRDASK